MNQDMEGRPIYAIKKHGQTGGYSIAIPEVIAEGIEGQQFAFSLTEDGFSYELVKEPREGLPDWLVELKER